MKAFEFHQQLHIGGGKLMVVKLSSGDPFYGGTIQRLRFTRQQRAAEEFQANRFFRVVVRNFFKQFANGNLHAEFLADFTHKTLLKSFARFTFAAGKFPQSAEVRAGMALRDEEFSTAKNERGTDFNLISNFQSPISNLFCHCRFNWQLQIGI